MKIKLVILYLAIFGVLLFMVWINNKIFWVFVCWLASMGIYIVVRKHLEAKENVNHSIQRQKRNR